MNINDTFSSNYLKALDIKKPTVVVIASCGLETLGQGTEAEEKLILGFRGAKKGMVLNKTNALQIAGMYGEETDNWIGQSIELFTMKVQGPNGIVDGIRVREPRGAAAAPAAPQAQAAAPAAAPAAAADFDDDIPF